MFNTKTLEQLCREMDDSKHIMESATINFRGADFSIKCRKLKNLTKYNCTDPSGQRYKEHIFITEYPYIHCQNCGIHKEEVKQ